MPDGTKPLPVPLLFQICVSPYGVTRPQWVKCLQWYWGSYVMTDEFQILLPQNLGAQWLWVQEIDHHCIIWLWLFEPSNFPLNQCLFSSGDVVSHDLIPETLSHVLQFSQHGGCWWPGLYFGEIRHSWVIIGVADGLAPIWGHKSQLSQHGSC